MPATATPKTKLLWSWLRSLARPGATMHDLYELESAPLPNVEMLIEDYLLCRELDDNAKAKIEYQKNTCRTVADVVQDIRKRDRERMEQWRAESARQTQMYILTARNEIAKLFTGGSWVGHLPAVTNMPTKPVLTFEGVTDEEIATFLRNEAPVGDQIPDSEREAAKKTFDQLRGAILARRPEISKLERITAAALWLFNSASIENYADQTGARTDDKTIIAWCEAAGIEKANTLVKDAWYKPEYHVKQLRMIQTELDVIQ